MDFDQLYKEQFPLVYRYLVGDYLSSPVLRRPNSSRP